MVGFAVVFGLLAVFIAQAWLNGQAERRMRSLEAQKKPVSASTIVVAKQRLQFGVELVRDQLREVPWPAEAMPEGAFARIGRIMLTGAVQDAPTVDKAVTLARQFGPDVSIR